jgi:hypothetical protein
MNGYGSYQGYNRSNNNDQNGYDISRDEERKRRQQLCCVDSRTITNMEEQGASQEAIDFAKRTQYSTDPDHVRRHRGYIKSYNNDDPWREPNNFILHPDNYEFDVKGRPNTKPEYIGQMFSTLQAPVYIDGPQIVFKGNAGVYLNPYIQYGSRPY